MLIQERIHSDPILEFLVEKASMTKAQLATYLSHRYGEKEGLGLAEKIRLRNEKKVTKGAFLRTLKQARVKLQKAVWTLLLAEYLGLIAKDGLSAVVSAGELLSRLEGRTLSEDAVTQVIDALVRTVNGIVGETS